MNQLEKLKILLEESPKEKKTGRIYDYGYAQIDLRKAKLEKSVANIRRHALKLAALDNIKDTDTVVKIINLVQDDFLARIDELIKLTGTLQAKGPQRLAIVVPNSIPTAIRPDLVADLSEMEKSFNSGCFRAATILCGRVLETALHRKYYEATGNDILEKNPGIGLGKLIAKLADKDVKLDPGLTQQIHLINQVRIHTVHKKKDSFYPSRQQTYAMILYTLDVLGKMF